VNWACRKGLWKVHLLAIFRALDVAQIAPRSVVAAQKKLQDTIP